MPAWSYSLLSPSMPVRVGLVHQAKLNFARSAKLIVGEVIRARPPTSHGIHRSAEPSEGIVHADRLCWRQSLRSRPT